MTSSASPKNQLPAQRKKILFWRGFQMRYALLVAGSLTVLLLFTGLHGLFVAQQLIPQDLSGAVKQAFQESTWRVFLVGFLYIAVVTLAAVFLSHREVGPVKRLEEELRDLASSDEPLHQVKVREGDGLEGLVESINHLLRRNLKKHD